MGKRQVLSINTITAADIKRRHPRHLTCETDRVYAQLANDIYELLLSDFTFMEDRQFRNVCINLTLFFEDKRSGLHLFEAFQHMYQKMYGCYLPFYATAGADAPEAPLDEMRFMLWHSCVAERGGLVLNPTNEALKNHAEKLLNLWRERSQELPSNEELANYLYAEETQTGGDYVTTVLVWLSRYCPLGRWFTNISDKKLIDEYTYLLHGADKDTMVYAAECFSMAEQRTWPLSVTLQHAYAEMIRIDMDDADDKLAEAIDHIDSKPFSIYEVVDCEEGKVRLKDFLGQIISVDQSCFIGNVKQLARRNTHLSGVLICFSGKWRFLGPSFWSKPEKKYVEKCLSAMRREHHIMHDFVGQYDDFVSSHGGERLYFFRNEREHRRWLTNELKLSAGELPVGKNENHPMAVFFEDNGLMTNCYEINCIKHPKNPVYSTTAAAENSMDYFIQRLCSPCMMIYLMKHDLLPDVMLNDMHGQEHGRRLMQDNIDFLARCLRRDITNDAVARPRTFLLEEEAGDNDAKQPLDMFVRLIAQEKSIRSKANKEWRVVSANATTTVIRDVARRKEHKIPTRAIYEAYLALDADQIQVATLVPFVGREFAPAASALLYNVVGKGQWRNNLRKQVNEIMNRGGFAELYKWVSDNMRND